MAKCEGECERCGLAGKVRGRELCLWVTVSIKGGRRACVVNDVETSGAEGLMGDVSLCGPQMNSDV